MLTKYQSYTNKLMFKYYYFTTYIKLAVAIYMLFPPETYVGYFTAAHRNNITSKQLRFINSLALLKLSSCITYTTCMIS